MPDVDVVSLSGEVLLAYVGPGAGITFLGSFFSLLVAGLLLLVTILTWPFRALLLAVRRWRSGLKPETSRVVVLGLDGLDPGRVDRLLAEGRLPNLQKLAEAGTYTRLETTLPPISPVAWSSFQTGVNPGKHNIFDFVNRDLRTYLPEISSVRIAEGEKTWLSRLGLGGTPVRMLRKSQPFWNHLGRFGVFSTILRVPISFPPEPFFGLSLSAMCTPDLRGTQGTFTLFTTDPAECHADTGGLRLLLEPAPRQAAGTYEAMLPGPPVEGTSQELKLPLRLKVDVARNQATLAIGGERLVLPLDKETGWVRLKFRAGWFTTVSGLCRFRLRAVQPHVRLYVSPIHLDPERPAMPISHPLYYSIYLAKLHEPFATMGLAEDTWALNSEVITEAAFLEQAYAIHDERERMFFDALRRMPRGLTVCVFDGPDRIQHLFYRHDVPDHPANRGRDVVQHAGVLDEMYAKMDRLVGKTMAEIRKEDVLVVLSDHGFCDFSRGVNLNAWLQEHGYLVLKEGAEPGDYLAGVDWSKTQAYAFGLTGIYLNLKGREASGIVPAADAPRLRKELAERLTGLRDPLRQRPAILKVHDAYDAWTGPYVSNGPDLIVGYERGYRASWDNALGRIDGEMFSDNVKYWSGDHCVDPSLVPGVLFLNRQFDDHLGASILDLAPTILKLLGVPIPGYVEGRPWQVSRPGEKHVDQAAVPETQHASLV